MRHWIDSIHVPTGWDDDPEDAQELEAFVARQTYVMLLVTGVIVFLLLATGAI